MSTLDSKNVKSCFLSTLLYALDESIAIKKFPLGTGCPRAKDFVKRILNRSHVIKSGGFLAVFSRLVLF